jgi:hypothetical protein
MRLSGLAGHPWKPVIANDCFGMVDTDLSAHGLDYGIGGDCLGQLQEKAAAGQSLGAS